MVGIIFVFAPSRLKFWKRVIVSPVTWSSLSPFLSAAVMLCVQPLFFFTVPAHVPRSDVIGA